MPLGMCLPSFLLAAEGREITREEALELYGQPLWGDVLFLAQGEAVGEEQVAVTPRINIDYAGEDAKLPYRFVMK